MIEKAPKCTNSIALGEGLLEIGLIPGKLNRETEKHYNSVSTILSKFVEVVK
jgi:hypothetical protein